MITAMDHDPSLVSPHSCFSRIFSITFSNSFFFPQFFGMILQKKKKFERIINFDCPVSNSSAAFPKYQVIIRWNIVPGISPHSCFCKKKKKKTFFF
jgi:hypothetical protein